MPSAQAELDGFTAWVNNKLSSIGQPQMANHLISEPRETKGQLLSHLLLATRGESLTFQRSDHPAMVPPPRHALCSTTACLSLSFRNDVTKSHLPTAYWPGPRLQQLTGCGIQVRGNMDSVLERWRSDSTISLNTVSAENLYDGDSNYVLAFIWQLIRCAQWVHVGSHTLAHQVPPKLQHYRHRCLCFPSPSRALPHYVAHPPCRGYRAQFQ